MIHSKPHQLTKLNMTYTLLLSATHTLLLLLLLSFSAAATVESTFPPDAVSLLAFKSHADLDHRLFYLLTEPFDYCQWQGVKCAQGRVVRLAVPGLALRGSLAPDSLSRLDQLRVLTLSNNSLSGPIPDLSPLQNLKYLFLSRNHFSGSFPPSLLSLHRLAILDLARNGLSGPIPDRLNALDRLTSLRLEFNRFNGSLPSLNHSLLSAFNVSGNNLSGPIPITPTLSRFGPTSFSLNSALCGEVLNRPCDSPASPFFDSSAAGPAGPQQSSPLVQTSESSESVVLSPNSPAKNHNKTGLIVGFVIAVAMLVAIALAASVAIRRRRGMGPKQAMVVHTPAAESELRRVTEGVVETKVKVVEEVRRVPKSGNLVFATGEAPLYGLEQLMRASAELLGRGTVGTTYKAVLDNQLVLTVKRLDAGKTAVTGSEAFGRHMDAVGGLRHPNLVPVRAYFQAKGERLVLFDYQPNGSLFNLIHGSRSTRAKPLHWTSCLKIAEDVAQGLAYIHNASKLTHGNLKSSNVLLGSDFEACLTDYGLAALAGPPSGEDDGSSPDSAGYRAPENRKWGRRGTAESDVYSFGVLLLELLTGKNPSQHPFLEVPEWVRAAREEEDAGDDGGQLGMLADVACICRSPSPEQRPAMWQVLKMIQEIKDSVGAH